MSIAAQLPPLDTDIDIGIWLEKWGQDPGDPQPREVLARVEAALRDDERWDRLVELLLRRLDLQEDEDEQLAALREVARIFRERLAAPARALMPGIAMLRLRPTDDELWEDLRADAGAADEWEQLVSQASEMAQAAGPTPEAARIWRELARVLREQLGRPDDALAAYREALVADPADRETRDAEADLLRQLERWQELAGVLRAASSEADEPARAVAHMLEVGELYETQLADPAARSPRTNRCWPSIPTRTAASRRARWSGCTRARSAGPIWPGCWNGARCSRAPADAFALRRRRAEILADDLESLDEAAEELELLSADDPEIADRSLLELLERVYQRAERHDDYLRTLAAPGGRHRRAGRAARDPAPAGGRGRSPARRAGSGGRGAGADPAHRAARRRRLLRAGAHLPRRGSAGGARRGDGAPARGHRHPRGASASCCPRWPRPTNASWTSGSRRSTPTRAPRRPATRGRRPTPRSTVWRSASDTGTSPPRRRASGPRTRPRTRARSRRCARVRRHNGELEAALHLFLDAAERETTGTAQAALLSEAALIVQGGLGKENRQSEQDEEEQAMELYVRALAADPDHAPAAERLAEIYATRGRWADVEELLDVVIDGLEPGETDRLVALEMKLAEACIQLGKTDKTRWTRRSTAWRARTKPRAESLPVLHKYGDLRMQRREWKDALNMYEAILRDQRQTLSPAETAEIAMQIGACHVELGNQDGALAAYLEAKTFDPSYRPALDALAAAYAAKEDWAAWVAERRQLADIAEPEEKRRPGGGDRRRVRRQAVGRRSAPRPVTARRWSWSPRGARRCTSCSTSTRSRSAGSRRSIC